MEKAKATQDGGTVISRGASFYYFSLLRDGRMAVHASFHSDREINFGLTANMCGRCASELRGYRL